MNRMFRPGVLLTAVTVLFLIVAGCKAAAPTATPVPLTPTKAPAVATVSPAPTTAPIVATAAPAPTAAPTATTPPIAQLTLPKAVKDMLVKYPQVKWYTELPLPATQPKYGGVYLRSGTLGIGGGIPHWNPRIAQQPVSTGAGMCYGGLLRVVTDRFTGRVTPVALPDAAESWKQLDELTYEFKLNPNVYWHDRPPVNGRRVTAEDIKWNLEQLRDNSIFAGTFQIISEVIIKDPSTIVLKTSQPYVHMPNILGAPAHVFTAPEMEKEPGGAKSWCIGFGPFVLTEWEANSNWALKRNPKFHLKGHTGMQLPYFDRVEVAVFADAATSNAAFVTGNIHALVVLGLSGVSNTLDRCGANCEGQVNPNSPAINWHMALRLDKPPFNDVRVRRALAMGLDYQAIIDTAYQGAAYISQQIPLDALGWTVPPLPNERGKYLRFNPTEAKRLLAEAGYPNGFKTTLAIGSATSGPQLAAYELFQFQWKQNLNVDVEFKLLEALTLATQFTGKTYEGIINGGGAGASLNWDTITHGLVHSKSPTNFYFVNDPEVDKWAEVQRTTFDPVKQREAYQKLYDLEEENIYRLNGIQAYIFTLWNTRLQNANTGLYPWINSYASRSTENYWFKN